MSLWSSKQMEGMEPLQQAKKAISHTLRQIHENPQLGYHAGVCTQTFSLLTEAAATLFGEPIEEVRKTFAPESGVEAHTAIVCAISGLVRDARVLREPCHAKLTDLLGQPQLVAIAQIDRELALTLKVLLDLTEEADFDQARHAAECVARKLRDLQLDMMADASGTISRGRDGRAAASASPPGQQTTPADALGSVPSPEKS